MMTSIKALAVCIPRLFARGGCVVLSLLALAVALSGCAGPAINADAVDNLPPLRSGDTTLEVADVGLRVPKHDLLSLDEPMRQFVARYTEGQGNAQLRLISLHQAVRGAGGLGVQYDPFADGTAREVFHGGLANCLSYANLFIAMAREAGLDARYQSLELRPRWNRIGERVQVGMHVNVAINLPDRKHYMVDIDPLTSRDVAGSRELTDVEGEALYYNNIAMDALANGELETAWLYVVRALQLSPSNAHLWVNLGAIYRSSGQHREAEQSYLQALDLDLDEYPAMSNLAVLYGLEGREEEQRYWRGRVERHRQSNPYYHAWLGDQAAAVGDWEAALDSYDRAVALLPADSDLVFSRGVIYFRLNDFDAATLDIEQAINLATLHSDVASYQRTLDEVRRARLAG